MNWQESKWAAADRNRFKAARMAQVWAGHARGWNVQTFLLSFDPATAKALAGGRAAAVQEASRRLMYVRNVLKQRVFGRAEVAKGSSIGWIDALEARSLAGGQVTPHVHLVVAVPNGCELDLDTAVHEAWHRHWKPGPRHPMQAAHCAFSAAAYALKWFEDIDLDRMEHPRTVQGSGWKARQYRLGRERQVRKQRALAEVLLKEKRELERTTGGLLEFLPRNEA